MSWQIDTLFISDVETLPPFLNVTRMVREQQRCLTRFPRRNAYFPRELLRLISCSDLALANLLDACAVFSVDAVWTENIKTIWLNIIVLKTDFIFTILLHYTKQACILNTLNTLLFFLNIFMIWLVPKKTLSPPCTPLCYLVTPFNALPVQFISLFLDFFLVHNDALY